MKGYNLNAATKKLSASIVREYLHYDPETGAFTWLKERHGKRWPAGRPAGYVCQGYLRINLFHVKLAASRFAWVYMTGEWPEALVDHRDGNKLNNRWANLRLATPSQNAMNSIAKRLTTTRVGGLKGATWCATNERWRASICKDGKQHNLGLYDTEDAAHDAYKKAAAKMFGEWARFE